MKFLEEHQVSAVKPTSNDFNGTLKGHGSTQKIIGMLGFSKGVNVGAFNKENMEDLTNIS